MALFTLDEVLQKEPITAERATPVKTVDTIEGLTISLTEKLVRNVINKSDLISKEIINKYDVSPIIDNTVNKKLNSKKIAAASEMGKVKLGFKMGSIFRLIDPVKLNSNFVIPETDEVKKLSTLFTNTLDFIDKIIDGISNLANTIKPKLTITDPINDLYHIRFLKKPELESLVDENYILKYPETLPNDNSIIFELNLNPDINVKTFTSLSNKSLSIPLEDYFKSLDYDEKDIILNNVRFLLNSSTVSDFKSNAFKLDKLLPNKLDILYLVAILINENTKLNSDPKSVIANQLVLKYIANLTDLIKKESNRLIIAVNKDKMEFLVNQDIFRDLNIDGSVLVGAYLYENSTFIKKEDIEVKKSLYEHRYDDYIKYMNMKSSKVDKNKLVILYSREIVNYMNENKIFSTMSKEEITMKLNIISMIPMDDLLKPKKVLSLIFGKLLFNKTLLSEFIEYGEISIKVIGDDATKEEAYLFSLINIIVDYLVDKIEVEKDDS